MKKFIPLTILALSMSSTIFAGTIDTNAKIIPLTVNSQTFTGEYNAYLLDGTTFVSDEDLTTITGTDERFDSDKYLMADSEGQTIPFYPLRTVIENSDGTVEWDSENFACDIYTQSEIYVIDGVNISDSILTTNGKLPVNIDGVNTYLTIESTAPVVTIEGNDSFATEVNEFLLRNQVTAYEVLQNSDKTVTKEVFTNNLTITNDYEILSSENGQVSIMLTSLVQENDNNYGTKTIINIDFNNETIKVTK